MRSKAYWGYDADFLAAIRDRITFTEDDLSDGSVFVLEVRGAHGGLYQIIGSPPHGELAHLWLEPKFIGRGLGRALFRHAAQTAAQRGFETLLIESEPKAEGFYATMGAERVGQRKSPVDPTRHLPLMRISIPAKTARSR